MASASGTATINGDFCYILKTDGIWRDSSGKKVYVRLKFTKSGSTTKYFPDSNGHAKYYYTTHSRLDAWSNSDCGSVAAGTWTVTLQWRGENTHNTRWHSTYGYLSLIIW